MSRFAVKELFATLQGEGYHAGRAAVFVRFAGCNLWSGREGDRATAHGACARYCDTDFVGTDGAGGGTFDGGEALADAVLEACPANPVAGHLVVLTGGEPTLQVTEALVSALHDRDFYVAIETNGTHRVDALGLDWVCVSPKPSARRLAVFEGHELKLLYPQPEAPPERFAGMDFAHFFLQPIDGPDRDANTRAAVAYCLAHPRWRLSLQTHKLVGIR